MESQVLSRSEHACRVRGCHAVSTVIVAADDRDVVRLCLRHAKDWSNSDLCRDFASTGHTNALRVLAKWLSLKSQTETARAILVPPDRLISGPQRLLASGVR